MVERIGEDKVAKRFGVTPRTVRDWLARGLPERRKTQVQEAANRSERAAAAAGRARTYRELGWKKFANLAEVDRFIGAPPGHTEERWRHRQAWWEEHRPDEYLPKRIVVVKDREGRLLYVNGDMVVWRGYTVDGRLFWTQATYLDGYDTADQMQETYERLQGRSVQIYFG
jgi:hypothetical protein